jgi:hypothetical protein
MATMQPQMSTGSAWHHTVNTVGDMGQQHAGPNGAIAMKGGRRQQRQQSKRQRQQRQQSRKQRQSRRHRQSRQRGGRK